MTNRTPDLPPHELVNSALGLMASPYDLSIILVTWNSLPHIVPCLKSILSNNLRNLKLEIIVVDNHSTDGTASVLSSQWAGVNVITNRENKGFSEATNQGLQQAHGKYILLLNPDTVVLGDALGTMLDVAEQDRASAIVGPQIISPEGVPQSCSARKLPTLKIAFLRLLGVERMWPGLFRQWTAYPLDHDQSVEAVSGACTLAGREVFDAIGPLDAALPMGGEDIDWYRRAKTKGITIRYAQKAQIIHIGGASRALALARTDLEGFRALYFYFKKHGSRCLSSGYLLVLLLTTIAKSILLLLYWPFSQDLKHQVVTKLTVCYRIMEWIVIRPKN